jgi:hypothetical protein
MDKPTWNVLRLPHGAGLLQMAGTPPFVIIIMLPIKP